MGFKPARYCKSKATPLPTRPSHLAYLVWKNEYYFNQGSDYLTENFQVKENRRKMRNVHSHIFHLLFLGVKN